MKQTIFFYRLFFLVACGVAGAFVTRVYIPLNEQPFLGLFLGLILGFFVILLDLFAKGVSLRAFSSATFGLLLGLVLATLVVWSGLFDYTTKENQWLIRLCIYLSFGYLGTMLAFRSNRDEFTLLVPYMRFIRQEPHEQVFILDSSAVIDGRLRELCKSGFLEGNLVVPSFVLKELQVLADSSDNTRRNKGRFALDLLKEMTASGSVEIKVHEVPESSEAVDSQLVRLAQILNGRIITTDYNLGRVAELQKVKVLNIHLLAGISRPQVVAGEVIPLKLVREGREAHQAVGFLADGTMIVVNHGRPLLGKDVEVVISSSIQTTAGRMIFAELSRSQPSTEGEK